MANWFTPYLVPRDSLLALRQSASAVERIEKAIHEHYEEPWGPDEPECMTPLPTWREAIQALLQGDQRLIQQDGHWTVYVAVAIAIADMLSMDGKDLDDLRYDELPGTLYPPCRFLPGIRLRQRPEEWFYLSYLTPFHVATEIRHAQSELRWCKAETNPEWNRGIREYLHWLKTAQKRHAHLAISFS
jgi:hypothetical protein